MIYVGGINSWCIEIQIFPDSPIAQMPKIAYDEHCSLNGRLKRGIGVLGLLALAISYIQKEFPHITKIQFDDCSYRECVEGQNIELAYFYYALYGETWYMNKIGARFLNESDKTRFELSTNTFQQLKNEMTWEMYDQYVNTAHPLAVDEMRTLYDNSKTWINFFQSIKHRVEIEDLCLYMAPWISNFIKNKTKLYFGGIPFILDIPNPKLGSVEFDVRPYVSNGGKYTRRNRKIKVNGTLL
jgi:hypothetical protein